MSEKTKIVIVGAGYAGIVTALELSKRNRFMRRSSVTVVDRNEFHLLMTELHRVAACEIKPGRISIPIENVLAGTGIDFVQAEVAAIDPVRRVVETGAGELEYDMLAVCTGSENFFPKIPGLSKHAHTLRSLEGALEIRARFKKVLESGKKEKVPPVIIVGAGATGVELAAYMRDRAAKKKSDVPVILVEASGKVLPGGKYTRRLLEKTQKHLERNGVELIMGAPLEKVRKNDVVIKGLDPVKMSFLVWAGGIQGRDIAASLAPPGPRKRVAVKPDLSLEAYPEVFVAGDAALVKGGRRPLPCSAQYALQMAETLATNIVNSARGKSTQRYVPEQRGEFISIGRGTAMGWMGLVEIWGYDAQFVKDSILYKYILRLGPEALKQYLAF